jgi:phosphohistidine phosphatase
MELYLIRHADAASLSDAGVTEDANRPLTECGKGQATAIAAALQKREIQLQFVVSSPLLRARQTAEGMLKDWVGTAPELRFCEELAPGAKRRQLARFLQDLGAERIAVVGHQPDLGEFAAWLIGGKKVRIEIAKAGIAHIRCEQKLGKGEGALEWLVSPGWFS